MKKPSSLFARIGVSLLFLSTVAGCAYLGAGKESHLVGELAEISGSVTATAWSGTPIVVTLLRVSDDPGAPAVLERRAALEAPGKFTFTVAPGRFRLGAFEDATRNLDFEPERGERCGAHLDLSVFEIGRGEKRKLPPIAITDDLPKVFAELESNAFVESNLFVEGKLASLEDPRFEPETGPLGLWRPITFAERYGMGLFMLEPYDPKRIPVVFVHGISGYPRQFAKVVACLDRSRLEPWVFQYPSGWRLEPIARGLHRGLENLHLKLGFENVFLVTHSMGGLVGRRVLTEHRARPKPPFIKQFISLASPLGGMSSADRGVSTSPIVIPSWRDVGTTSRFVETLYGEALPEGTEYSLFFAWHGGESDGVVELRSQLRDEAQHEASHLFGINTTHDEILDAREICDHLNAKAKRAASLGTDPSASPLVTPKESSPSSSPHHL